MRAPSARVPLAQPLAVSVLVRRRVPDPAPLRHGHQVRHGDIQRVTDAGESGDGRYDEPAFEPKIR